MVEFIDFEGSILTFVFFLVALYLYKTSKEKRYFLLTITALMFLYTILGMPFTQKAKAQNNIALYEKGNPLSCASGFMMFGSTYKVDNKNWDLKENYLVHKQSSEKIRADKCEEF